VETGGGRIKRRGATISKRENSRTVTQLAIWVRIPSEADQDSGLIPITIPN
jgi:hypothetical protein